MSDDVLYFWIYAAYLALCDFDSGNTCHVCFACLMHFQVLLG